MKWSFCERSFITSAISMWRLCLIRDVINTCDDTIHNLSAYVCDWSLGAHKILHSILSLKSGVTKMYLDLKEKYWWYGLKRDVAEYVALCETYQRVKAEHQRPTWLLQPMKTALFIPVKTHYKGLKLAQLYMEKIVCLHGVPKKIVSDRCTQFTSHFW